MKKKNKTTMLDFCKKVLDAVSFDQELFTKEYHKSISWLTRDESLALEHWVRNEAKFEFDILK